MTLCLRVVLCSAWLLTLAGCASAGSAAPESSDPGPSHPSPGLAIQLTEEVNFACTEDSDCAIKNVGNCCGEYPACVNRDSPTFPERVKADCEREGRMAICGFPSLSGCRCEAGHCRGIQGPATPAAREEM